MSDKNPVAVGGAGFVLPELAVVLALLTLMAVLTAPTFRGWLLRDQVDQAARNLLATFSYARSEAQRLGRRVEVCRADSSAHCAAMASRCGAGAQARGDNWACGWLVTMAAEPLLPIGLGGGGASQRSRVLRRYPASTGLSIISPTTALSFMPPAGQVAGNFRSFEIKALAPAWAASRMSLSRCIRLAIAGRPRISDGACGGAL